MKLLISIIACAGLMNAQQDIVYGKLTVESLQIQKTLFGRAATSVQQGFVAACASGPAGSSVTVQPADFYIHVSGVAPMASADAVAIITKSFNGQSAQSIARDLTWAGAGIGLAVATGGASSLLGGLSAKALGYILGGTTVMNQAVIPWITSNQMNLQTLLAGTLDQMGPVTLTPGGTCIYAKFYLVALPKGSGPAEAAFSFIPGTAPVGTPVTLHRVSMAQPKEISPATYGDIKLAMLNDDIQDKIGRENAQRDESVFAHRSEAIAQLHITPPVVEVADKSPVPAHQEPIHIGHWKWVME